MRKYILTIKGIFFYVEENTLENCTRKIHAQSFGLFSDVLKHLQEKGVTDLSDIKQSGDLRMETIISFLFHL